MKINNPYDLHKHMLDCYPEEGCGIVVDDVFVPIKNTHPEPQTNFKIDQEVLKDQEIQGVIHSHTSPLFINGKSIDPRTPSMNDVIGQESSDVIWGIVACDGETVTDVLWFGEQSTPLVGREFIINVNDCYTLVRDYYKQEHNVELGVYPRPIDWEKYDKHIYENHFRSEGFEIVIDPEPGDLIFFHIMHRDYVDHAGIYLGDDRFLHHQYGRLSCVDSLSRWHKHIAYFSRNTRVNK